MTANADTLTDRTARAATWRLASSAVGAIAQFLIGVLLARLLAPADFGLMALAFVVLGFARPLGDLGVGNAIVQRRTLTERHVRTGFTISVLLGVAIATVVAASAPLAALVLRDPHVAPVLRALAAGFVLSGLAVVAGGLLRRQLDFKSQFFIEVVSYVLGYGAVACTLALRGYGVWSLVYGSLVQTLIASGAQLAYVRHSVRPCLARRELEELLHFGLGSAASACVNYVALNADNFVVGRSIGAFGLGLYNRAYTLMNVPYTYASSVMSSVLFPACAEAQGDPARLRRAFLLLTRLTAMVAAPAMATMAIAAPHLVRGVYGERWAGVVAPLQILCVAGYFRALYHLGGIVAQSAGHVYRDLRNQILYAGVVIAGALVGARFDIRGVATGVGVAILCMFIVTGRLALSVTGVGWRQYFRIQVSALVTALIVGGAALSVRQSLEARQAPSALIALAVLAAAAVPWSASMLWALGEPAFAPFRERLGGPISRLIEAVQGLRPREAAISG